MKKETKNIYKILIIVCVLISATTLVYALVTETSSNNDLEIYFYPLNTKGSAATGDSCIIKIGDVEVLIDAGSSEKSAPIITEKMKSCISPDNVWDYIIISHADKDHISACKDGVFALFKDGNVITDKDKWTLSCIIDFDVTNDDTVKFKDKESLFDTQVYKDYKASRDKVVKACNSKYYTASQCCWQQRKGIEYDKSKNPKSNIFDLGNGAKLNILYNYYYDHRFNEKNQITSLDRNLLSVCVLIEYGNDQRFLFTGDLEEYNSVTGYSQVNGESLLLKNNPILKKGVTFYKAGHHGSRTSSSENFIDEIRPQYVVIPAVAGSREHISDPNDVFPASVVIDRILKYTDYIYIPELAINEVQNDKVRTVAAENYHGNIVFRSDGENITVETESNKDVPFQSTKWFKENRNEILSTYVFGTSEQVVGVGHCTLIKYGHIDILIDCGLNSDNIFATNYRSYIDRVKNYCVDGVIEYLIVTGAQTECLSQIISEYSGNTSLKNGIFDEFQVVNLIDFGKATNITVENKKSSNSWLARYYKERDDCIKSGRIKHYNTGVEGMSNGLIEIADDFTMKIFNFNQGHKITDYKNEDNYSLCLLFNFKGKKLFFAGDLSSEEGAENKLIQEAESNISNVTFYLAADGASKYSNGEELLSILRPEYVVMSAPISLEINDQKKYPDFETCTRLLKYTRYTKISDEISQKIRRVYYINEFVDGKIKDRNGDITFKIIAKNNQVKRESLTGSKATILLKETDWYKNQNKHY